MHILYKLYFRSPHTVLDSIKLSGAIIDALMTMYPDRSEELLEEVISGTFAVSDAFPFSDLHGYALFPSPAISYAYPFSDSRESALSQSVGRKDDTKFSTLDKVRRLCTLYTKNSFRISRNEADEILSKPDASDGGTDLEDDFNEYGVSINNDGSTEVYVRELAFHGNFKFRRGMGIVSDPLWFVLESGSAMFRSALPFLKDRGISGMITRGKGAFHFEEKDCDFSIGFSDPGYYLLLSPLIPGENEIKSIDLEMSRYNFGLFSGRNRNAEPIGKYRYFRTGSILYLSNPVRGIAVQVSGERVISFKPLMVRVA